MDRLRPGNKGKGPSRVDPDRSESPPPPPVPPKSPRWLSPECTSGTIDIMLDVAGPKSPTEMLFKHWTDGKKLFHAHEYAESAMCFIRGMQQTKDALVQALLHINVGLAIVHLCHFAEAITFFSVACREHEMCGLSHLLLGVAQYYNGEYAAAFGSFEECLDAMPDNQMEVDLADLGLQFVFSRNQVENNKDRAWHEVRMQELPQEGARSPRSELALTFPVNTVFDSPDRMDLDYKLSDEGVPTPLEGEDAQTPRPKSTDRSPRSSPRPAPVGSPASPGRAVASPRLSTIVEEL